jgi:hypothetical protein
MHLRFRSAFPIWAAALIAALECVGCGPPDANTQVNAELARTGKQRVDVYPLAGRVTIDGQPPAELMKGRMRVIVMLNDVSKPDAPPASRPFVECDPEGQFKFSSYGKADGLPAATYVVTIADLKYNKKEGYVGPDGFKNLYNDPEKNANIPEFKIDHKAPGKSDYDFDLKVGSKDAATAGPKALTTIPQ